MEKLLKLEPSNTELLAQKQRLLTDAIKETKENLESLKTAAQSANEHPICAGCSFAVQYKIKVQGNVGTCVLVSRKKSSGKSTETKIEID